LLAAAGAALALGKLTDGAVVLGAVVVNAIIGFLQEHRAGKAIAALSKMVPQDSTVLRDGERAVVPASELVPGDVVQLAAGDRVPADLRLLAARALRAEEAALTGESVPVGKDPAPVPADAALGDRRSMIFGGTHVTSGAATAVVVETGVRTELGRISAMLAQVQEVQTPLTRSLARVGGWLTAGVGVIAAALLAVGLARGFGFADALLFAITVAVAAIPEGLPAIITIALAIGVQRMAARRAIVRHLPSVETLGSTTVICTDKTGTLTRNEMTVQGLWTPDGPVQVTGIGYAPEGLLLAGGRPLEPSCASVRDLLRAAALNNDATVFRGSDGAWAISGDPTEAALVTAAEKGGIAVPAVREAWRRLDAIPFDPARQLMATLHATPDGG
ncbi:MAG TPA: HAD-IC family P-type ATPase, partial [Anaeromyxobacteraceae bacterium]|nr:HAD-IC family P-type ATPase [Anaeromyxobacteraceae bacterium]